MVFSSAYFILLFLPLVLTVYFLTPRKYRNLVLLASSLWFYAYGEGLLVLVMVFSTIVDFYAAQLIEAGRRKLGLRLSIATNLTTLGIFKYFNFGIDNFLVVAGELGMSPEALGHFPEIILPMGISFYVFQTMSYTIDVYRNQVKANRNFIEFATYVTMFPQLVAGPIVRYVDIKSYLSDRSVDLENFALGLERFILGLAKKLIIANTFAGLADVIFMHTDDGLSTGMAWLGVFAYSIQIYYDFSGYSDMAIGLGRMMGFTIPENFNYPFISKSITEFWRRWHISLSTWFRDYLYIPLGGNRVSKSRMYANLVIVFAVTGLWHGAAWTFIIWGLLHGFFILIEKLFLGKLLNKLPDFVGHLYMLFVIFSSWALFRADDISQSWAYLNHLFVYTAGNSELQAYIKYLHIDAHLVLVGVVGILFSLPLYPAISKRLKGSHYFIPRYVFITGLFFLCLTYLASGSYNPFIYFRF
ncbi:MAG: MBOAT family O-acyltransferase [Nonlabens sp.]